MALTLHDSKIISWEKIMNVEDLTVISRFIFLKHYFDYIMVLFSDQKNILSRFPCKTLYNQPPPHLYWASTSYPIILATLQWNLFDLLTLQWTCGSHSCFHGSAHIIPLKLPSHFPHLRTPVWLWKTFSFSSSTKPPSNTLTYFLLPKGLRSL